MKTELTYRYDFLSVFLNMEQIKKHSQKNAPDLLELEILSYSARQAGDTKTLRLQDFIGKYLLPKFGEWITMIGLIEAMDHCIKDAYANDNIQRPEKYD